MVVANVTTQTPITSAWGNSVADAINNISSITDWQSPISAVASAGGGTNWGTGASAIGRIAVTGHQCQATLLCTAGAVPSSGAAGEMILTLPFGARTAEPHVLGGGYWTMGAGAIMVPFHIVLATYPDKARFMYSATWLGAAVAITNTAPAVLAAGNVLRIWLSYEMGVA